MGPRTSEVAHWGGKMRFPKRDDWMREHANFAHTILYTSRSRSRSLSLLVLIRYNDTDSHENVSKWVSAVYHPLCILQGNTNRQERVTPRGFSPLASLFVWAPVIWPGHKSPKSWVSAELFYSLCVADCFPRESTPFFFFYSLYSTHCSGLLWGRKANKNVIVPQVVLALFSSLCSACSPLISSILGANLQLFLQLSTQTNSLY